MARSNEALSELSAILLRSGRGSGSRIPVSISWPVGLPSDYIGFVRSYGYGSFREGIAIFAPESVPVEEAPYPRIEDASEEARELLRGIDDPPLAVESVVVWGCDDTGGLLAWEATGDTSDAWPVWVWSRQDHLWRRYDCGMAEFLLGVFQASFPENPVGSSVPWGCVIPHYVPWGAA